MYVHISIMYFHYTYSISEAVKWLFYRNVYYMQQNSVIYPVTYSDARSSIFSIVLTHLFMSSYYPTSLSKLKVDSIFQKLLSRLKHTHKKQRQFLKSSGTFKLTIFSFCIENFFLKKQIYLQNNFIISWSRKMILPLYSTLVRSHWSVFMFCFSQQSLISKDFIFFFWKSEVILK